MSTRAEQSKQAGNSAFRSLNYPLALAHYSTAIQLDPSISTYPLNRAAVYLKTGQYGEAEKDATRALELEGGVGAKALFRRGMARKGLGKLEGAREDFEEAKKQGAGADVDAELTSLVKELELKGKKGGEEKKPVVKAEEKKTEKENVKPEKAVPSPSPAAKPAPAKPASASSPSPSTDRLRAALSSPSKNSASSSSTSAAPSRSPVDGLLRAVSTRRLTPSSSPSAPPQPQSPPPAAAPASPPPAEPAPPPPSTEKPTNSFASKKTARDARQAQPFRSSSSPAPPPPAAPTLAAPAVSSPPPPITAAAPPIPLVSPSLPAPPPSLFPTPSPKPALNASSSSAPTPTALEALHLSLPLPGHPSRLAALHSLPTRPPSALRAWAGEGGLTPDLLSSILADLSAAAAKGEEEGEGLGEEEWKYELVRALPGCKRWDSAVLFLEEGEKEVVRRILEGREKELRRVEGGWGL